MSQIEIATAAGELSALVERARAGEQVLLSSGGRPVAQIVALSAADKKPGRRRLGTLAGRIRISDSFDAPLPPEILDAFEGKA